MSEIHPNSQNVLEAIRRQLGQLRKSDRKVADAILADPQRFLAATVADTAHTAGVSQPTVIRFATAIGCNGFQDFKLRLAQALALGTPATHSVLLETDGPETVFEKIFDYTISSLDWTRKRIDTLAVARAIDILTTARAIDFFGFGASGIVAQDAQQKFPLFGVPCGAPADLHQQVMVASMMQPGHVAVVISNTGTTPSMIDVARLARQNGARVIGLIGTTPAPLIAHCDVAIVIETLDNTNDYTPTISRLAALAVIDVLSTAVGLRRDPTYRNRVAVMKRRLQAYRGSTTT
ncbi:RpiR family transcriptional regulator [Dongia mobilis]|uniref:RpiR family transcriptional regulator n=1 Tax=Dongia mobilis TaxID=578943 RepID=A0A4R6WQM0_9PROT|nr:SIS domain-containing protein [Dongia mobilis]TDQ83882.1 RpiR family transcriptional regulator [Dongia mobilis]